MVTSQGVYDFYVKNKSLNVSNFFDAFVNRYGEFADCKSANLYRWITRLYRNVTSWMENKTKDAQRS